MALSSEEAQKIKDHLLKQVPNFPKERQQEIRDQIIAMSPDDVENLVKQNQLTHLGDQCIICAIAQRQVESFEVAEDDANLAVLEIRPLSKGHTIVFPKKHTDPISPKTRNLASIVAQKLEQHFSPNKVQTKETKIMGHPVLEVIPLYGDETERKEASPQELSAIKKGLSLPVPPKPKVVEKKEKPKEKKAALPKLKPRMP